MRLRTSTSLLLVALLVTAGNAMAGVYTVAPEAPNASDINPGTSDLPFKTLAKALSVAVGGDTICLGDGQYPAVTITTQYTQTLTLQAVDGAQPVFVGGIAFQGAQRVRLQGVKFTWAPGASVGVLDEFIAINNSSHIEVEDCFITDALEMDPWRGFATTISHSDYVAMRNCRIYCVYFGINVEFSEHVELDRVNIQLWAHEDGIRVRECFGPVLIDGCYITNTGQAGNRGGHVDAIQVVFWSDDLTIRNCEIHGVAQAIGAFHCVDDRATIPNRRRINWRIEGNLIYDVYTPHYITVCETDGLLVANNTVPQGRNNVLECTGVVVKNNIYGAGGLSAADVTLADYNLWMNSSTALGPHDLVMTNPQFVNAETAFFKIYSARLNACTRTRLYPREINGRLAVGNHVEIMLTDGSPRDGSLYLITAMGNESGYDWIEISPPLPADPDPLFGVLIYKWPEGHTNLQSDYHLRSNSPAIDSADGSIGRAEDMEGNLPFDVPSVANTGVGTPAYLDRGALEYVFGTSVAQWQTAVPHGGAEVLAVVADDDIECRATDDFSLLVSFSSAIDPATVSTGVVSITAEPGGDVSHLVEAVSLIGSNQLRVDFSGPLPDGCWCTFTLGDALKGQSGASILGDKSLRLGFLLSDVDSSGAVTAADVLQVRSRAGRAAAGADARYDLDGSGLVTGADMLRARRRIGGLLP